MQLTGRTRHRAQGLFRKVLVLVLQVEETGLRTTCCAGLIDTDSFTRWRDASVEDLAELTGLE